MKPTSVIDLFVSRDRQARIWFALFLLSIGGFMVERSRMVASLTGKPQVIVMGPHGYYLPKNVDFESATDMHVGQTVLAMESLFNRHPKGPDNPERLKRLFDEKTYRKASKDIEAEANEFAAKRVHQKVELGPIKVLQVRDHTVLTSVTGQLIRTGLFENQNVVEVLEIKARFKFRLNPDMAYNGRFPTVVNDYDAVTKQRPSHG